MSGLLCAIAVVALLVVARRPSAADRLRGLTHDGPQRPPVDHRMGWVAAAVALGAGVVAAGVPPAAAGATAAAVLLARVSSQRRRRQAQRERVRAAVIEVTVALAAELRAGREPPRALAAAAPTAGPLQAGLAAAAAATGLGASAAEQLDRLAEEPGAEQLRQVAAAWSVTESAGGQVAAVLDGLAGAMDAQEQLRQELQAALAGPRATIAVLAGLPLMGVALGEAVGAAPLRLLLHRPLGWALLAAAGGLDLAGVAIMRRIMRSAASA